MGIRVNSGAGGVCLFVPLGANWSGVGVLAKSQPRHGKSMWGCATTRQLLGFEWPKKTTERPRHNCSRFLNSKVAQLHKHTSPYSAVLAEILYVCILYGVCMVRLYACIMYRGLYACILYATNIFCRVVWDRDLSYRIMYFGNHICPKTWLLTVHQAPKIVKTRWNRQPTRDPCALHRRGSCPLRPEGMSVGCGTWYAHTNAGLQELHALPPDGAAEVAAASAGQS